MPHVTSAMSLRVWNLLQDLYDHTQFSDNWARIDQHDHTPNRGVQIPTEGIADGAITQPKLASNIQTTPVAGSVAEESLSVSALRAIFRPWRTIASPTPLGANSGNVSATGIPFYVDPADYDVPGLTTEFRMTISLSTGGTPPASTMTYGYYAVTGIVSNTPTLGAAQLGGTVDFDHPAANSLIERQIVGPLAGAGWYVPRGDFSPGIAGSSFSSAHLRIEVHNV